MVEGEHDFRQLVSQLETGQFTGYLLSKGWHEKPSRYAEHAYFVGKIHEGEDAYELYVPGSTTIPKYQTYVMRAIYKLCGIEDREPAEIALDMLAIDIAIPATSASTGVTRLRVKNTDSAPLHLQIDSPRREHTMLAGESIELLCHVDESGMLEIERDGASLIIRAPKSK